MKALLLFLALILPAFAGEVTFGWPQNTDTIDGYVLRWKYAGIEHKQSAGLDAVATVKGLVHGRRYEFWVTAIRKGTESAESDHLSGTFVTVTLEWSDDFKTWQAITTRADLVQVPRRFWRARLGDL